MIRNFFSSKSILLVLAMSAAAGTSQLSLADEVKVHVEKVVMTPCRGQLDASGLRHGELVALNGAKGAFIGRFREYSTDHLEDHPRYQFTPMDKDGFIVDLYGLNIFNPKHDEAIFFHHSNMSTSGTLPYEKVGIAKMDPRGPFDGSFVKKATYELVSPDWFGVMDRFLSAMKIQKKSIMVGRIIKTFTPVASDNWPIALVKWEKIGDKKVQLYQAEYLKDLAPTNAPAETAESTL